MARVCKKKRSDLVKPDRVDQNLPYSPSHILLGPFLTQGMSYIEACCRIPLIAISRIAAIYMLFLAQWQAIMAVRIAAMDHLKMLPNYGAHETLTIIRRLCLAYTSGFFFFLRLRISTVNLVRLWIFRGQSQILHEAAHRSSN